MTPDWLVVACLALGVASALVAGVFQTFSDFVMRALAAARPAAGLEVMIQINRTVHRSVFMVRLLGLIPATLATAGLATAAAPPAAGAWIVAGSGVYGSSVFLLTILGNVPMNRRLDRLNPGDEAARTYWQTYTRRWTRLNHVRTLGSLVAALCFLAAALTLA